MSPLFKRRSIANPLSEQSGNRPGAGCMLMFFMVFLLAGVAFLIPFFILPVWRSIASRGWVATPCVIDSSTVTELPDADGSTYRITVAYHYSFGGRTYSGTRYNFETESSSSRGWRAA